MGINDDIKSNWYEWDNEAKKFSYQKTKDHVFAPYMNGGKRIGDMTRDELIHVIAMGYEDRENFAKALLLLAPYDERIGVDISSELHNAELIVRRVEAESGLRARGTTPTYSMPRTDEDNL